MMSISRPLVVWPDFLAEDEMFELVEIVSTTAVFRRTERPLFSPHGDRWWEQRYNRRRSRLRAKFFEHRHRTRRPE